MTIIALAPKIIAKGKNVVYEYTRGENIIIRIYRTPTEPDHCQVDVFAVDMAAPMTKRLVDQLSAHRYEHGWFINQAHNRMTPTEMVRRMAMMVELMRGVNTAEYELFGVDSFDVTFANAEQTVYNVQCRKRCVWCGQAVPDSKQNRKYCSQSCKSKTKRLNQKERQENDEEE